MRSTFLTRLLKPFADDPVDWAFVDLPAEVSRAMPSRGLVTVSGHLRATPFVATLQPDGEGGHWLRVEPGLLATVGATWGDEVEIGLEALAEEPEPAVPDDWAAALAIAAPAVRAAWADVTPKARRDWIHWMTSAKRPETRERRIRDACDMLAQGKRRPCCFDSSGRFSKGLGRPEEDRSPLP